MLILTASGSYLIMLISSTFTVPYPKSRSGRRHFFRPEPLFQSFLFNAFSTNYDPLCSPGLQVSS
ncbi:hypothetical protein D770_13115 [Flammeovirgaceae bacterium 311]|nr:hypothetical protein D770_13115 [Flammeovirgaceae bacterium 311]